MMGEPEGATKPRHYKELRVWQRGIALARVVYGLTARFPVEERFGLTTQMRRAAVAVPSNIAEGQARRTTKEFTRFLALASGSLAELETQLLLSVDLGFAEPAAADSLITQIGDLQRIMAGLKRKLTEAMVRT